MAVSPLMFREAVNPGSKVKLSIEIQNLQSAPATATIALNSVVFEDGTYVPQFGVQHPRDSVSWFSQKQLTVNIPAVTTKSVDLDCSVPRVKNGVYWCMATVDPKFQGDRSTITAQYQIPLIFLVGRQPRPALKLGTPELTGTPSNSQVSIPFENEGDGFTVIGDIVQLKQTRTGRVVNTFMDTDRNLYPGTKRNLTYSVGALAPGEYSLVSRPQAGTRSFAQMVSKFAVTKTEVKPATDKSLLEMAPVIVDPPALKLEMPAGGQRSAVVRVTNVSKKPITVDMLARTLTQTVNGAIELGTEAPRTPLTITADPPRFDLEPGRTQAVRIVVAGDKSAVGDQWFGLSAKTTDANEIAEELYGSVSFPGGNPNMEVRTLELKKLNGYPVSLSYQVRNSGTMALRPIAFAQVLESGLTAVATLQIPKLGDGGVLPGSVLTNEVALPLNLKPGPYTVNVKYQYGQDLFANLTVPITIGKAK